VAYTQNGNNTLDPFTVSATKNINGGFRMDPDANLMAQLYHASGTINTSNVVNAEHPITIKFRTVMSIFQVVVNSRGLFGGMTDLEFGLSGNLLNKHAVFNLKSGRYTNFQSFLSSETEFTNSNLKDYSYTTDGANKNFAPLTWAKSIILYVPTNKDGNITNPLEVSIRKVKLKRERITGGDSGDPIFDYRYMTYSTLRAKSFASFSPDRAREYRMTMNLVESGVKVGNTTWARGDLLYLGYGNNFDIYKNGAVNRYRFLHPNVFIDSTTTQFITTGNTIRYFDTGIYNFSLGGSNYTNPCSAVYPTGIWDMPTHADFSELVNASGKTLITTGLDNKRHKWFFYFSDSNTNPDGYQGNDKRLYIIPTGFKYRVDNTLTEFRELLTTSTLKTDIHGYWRIKSTGTQSRPYIKMSINSSDVVTLDANSIQDNTTSNPRNLFTIRCIRTK